jgi:DNA-binding MurR/RpiR family transcriptional regulator
MNALETAARAFVVSPKAGRQLERHRATVLILRAKDATFLQIQDMLAQHGVAVSESSITRFCRKHRAEIQRLRLQLEQEFDPPSGTPPVRAVIRRCSCSVMAVNFLFRTSGQAASAITGMSSQPRCTA